MKKFVFVFASACMMISATVVSAANLVVPAVVATIEDDKKVEIAVTELPKSAQEHLNANHSGATFKAYKWVDASEKVTGYEVVASQGGKDTTITFDASGNLKK